MKNFRCDHCGELLRVNRVERLFRRFQWHPPCPNCGRVNADPYTQSEITLFLIVIFGVVLVLLFLARYLDEIASDLF